VLLVIYFFFQAEDGIRDFHVTGVQTCALPISVIALAAAFIMGLFITLEIAPVLVKLISAAGPYDYLLEKTENDYRLYSKEKIEKGNAGTDWRIEDFKDKLGN